MICILLAAGKSQRMGQAKGTLDYHGTPWLQVQILQLGLCGIQKIILVLGDDHKLYENIFPVADLESKVKIDIEVVINPEVPLGPFRSLQKAFSITDGDCFVLPIDTPCPEPEVWNFLKLNLKTYLAVTPSVNEKTGHPVLLSHRFIEGLKKIKSSDPNYRLDRQLSALSSNEFKKIEVTDHKILMNLNTPEQWNQFLKQNSKFI